MKQNQVIVVVVALFAILGVLFVPIIPYSYQVQVPYQTTEDVQVPYQETAPQSSILFTLASYTLQPNYYLHPSAQISSGKDVSVSWSADDTVNIKAFNSDQYNLYAANTGNPQPIVSRDNVASGTLGFHVSATDTYYFVIFNPHNGFFGLGSHNVGIFSAGGTATWQETVTKYRTETHTVTKWRTDTKNVNINLFNMFTGQLPKS
jgi:hypothetical protein